MERMLCMLDALELGQSDTLQVITIPGAPWSKSRPRFARTGRTYTDPADRDAEHRTAAYLRAGVREPYSGNVGMACLFFRPNRQRIDVDNLLKHVCDSGNGVLWADDSQCTALMGVLELDADRPRTVVAIGEHVSTLTRGTDNSKPCDVCEKPIVLTASFGGRIPKTCSRECGATIRGYVSLADLFPCAQCSKRFRRKTKTQTFCSVACRQASVTDKAKASGRPMSNCSECGAQLAHKRGGRCRACWCANPRQASEARP